MNKFHHHILAGLILGFSGLGISGSVSAERISLFNKNEYNARALIKSLSRNLGKFDLLLKMRVQVNKWEIKLTSIDNRLHTERKQSRLDVALVARGKLSRSLYRKKWETTGRIDKLNAEIQKFRQEILNYNKFRQGYNKLAKDMSRHLQRRKPEDLKTLMTAMRSLLTSLQQEVKNRNFSKAVVIAKNSKIAREFGYPEK